ncbi:hypothetical protein B0H16DRAFT_1450341 [Mycena metata]|uniref:F-box domain-containing protein n=1 Tax=Mycena metata TaxID=1033252 RepID=A0AAD7K1D8_9AGAR|nr:hypothetical protein B0H16DRAFT_1450341 [Mycena metata]
MSDPSLPHPSWDFFFQEDDVAIKFMGFYEYGLDYELALLPSATQGNAWHYRNRRGGALHRALLFGEVLECQAVPATLGEHGLQHVVKLTVRCVPNASPKMARVFTNDHLELSNVVESDRAQPPYEAESWVGRVNEQDVFFIDYSPLSTVINGPVIQGSKILVDASFSRLDLWAEGTGARKIYRIIAHEIERVGEAYLDIYGVTEPAGFVGEEEMQLGARMSGVLLHLTMIIADDCSQVDNFIGLVHDCDYNIHTEEFFSRMSNDVVFVAAMEDTGCWDRVMRWVRSITYAPVNLSQAGVLAGLPAELVYRVVGHMDLRSRVAFARTSRDMNYLCTSLAHYELGVICATYHLDFTELRFMLVASHTCMAGYALQSVFTGPRMAGDSIDFFTSPGWDEYVIAFLLKSNHYSADPSPMVSGGYIATTLRSGTRHIRVITCPKTALEGVISQNHSARFGYCDGYRIRHAYAELMDERVTLTTAGLMAIPDDISAHVETWKAVHKALRHGLKWVFDYWKPHDCRDKHSFSCPANLRDTLDGGWFQWDLFDSAYDGNKTIQLIAWPFFGGGCKRGTIRGNKFKKVPCVDARYISSFDWVHLSINSVALRGPILGMGNIRGKGDGEEVSFTVFGVIKSVRSDGTVAIGRPAWQAEGSTGLALMVRYDEQLLALARALESRNLCGSFDDHEIILTSRGSLEGTIGKVVCATATLTVEADIDFTREEHYTLNASEITLPEGRSRRPKLHRIELRLVFRYPWRHDDRTRRPCVSHPTSTMSAFRAYLLQAFSAFLRSRRWVLWKYDVEDWKWTPTETGDGIMACREVESEDGGVRLRPISFNLFGIVTNSPRDGALTMKKLDVEGTLGREFDILFDMQLWTLSRILERVGHDGILNGDDFLVINNIGHIVEGAALIATATLLIRTGDHDEVDDYELRLRKVHVMYVEEPESE